MKIDCGPSRQTKHRNLATRHLWFAWYPIRLGDHDCRWLEYVWRTGKYYGGYGGGFWDWTYEPRHPSRDDVT